MKNLDPVKNYLIVTLNKADAYTFDKVRYTRSQLDAFEEVNLIALLHWLYGSRLKKVDTWLTITGYPNLIVFPEAVYDRVNRRVYGPIEALKLLFNYNFPQSCYVISRFFDFAIADVSEQCAKMYPEQMSSRLLEFFNLNAVLDDNLLTSKSDGNRKAMQIAFGTLHQELGISRSVIAALIAERRLAINKQNKQLVFCFLQYQDGKVVTNTKYKNNINGEFAFSVDTVNRDATFTKMYKPKDEQAIRDVYVFENIIELLSFLTLVEAKVIEETVENSCLISLNSTYPYPLMAYLKEHSNIDTIHTCLSNQTAGFAATNSILENKTLSKYKIIKADDLQKYTGMHGKYVKTWNEMLREYHIIRRRAEIERRNEAVMRKIEAELNEKNNLNDKGDSDHE